MSIVYNTNIKRDGLLLYLDAANRKCYSGTGTSCNNLGLTTITGSMGVGAGFDSVSNSFTFNNAVTSQLTFGTGGTYMPFLSGVSLEVWYKCSGLGVGQGQAGVMWVSYGIGINIIPAGIIQFAIYDLPTLTSTYTNTTGVNGFDGNWKHIVCTNDKFTNKIYVNGELIISAVAPFSGTNGWTGSQACIGNNINNTLLHFVGNIAISKIFNYALSPADIKNNFNSLRGRFGI